MNELGGPKENSARKQVPVAQTIWRLARVHEIAELILIRSLGHCELTLLVNGQRVYSSLFDLDDESAWHRAAANHRHVLEIQGWSDGRRLSGVRWRAAADKQEPR